MLEPKLKLFSVLAAFKELLHRSPAEGWGGENPAEWLREVDQMIACVLDPQPNPWPKSAQLLCAPTGPLQEISLANGWPEAFLALAAEYEALVRLIADDQSK